MVRNTKGGNKGKKGARRRSNQTDKSNRIRLKSEPEERYAKIRTVYGNNMAEILCDDNIVRCLVWRKKFRGRNKRDNKIITNGVVLVGIREWEVVAKDKKPKADLLYVYSKDHISELHKKKDINRKIFPDEMNESLIEFDKGIQDGTEIEEEEGENIIETIDQSLEEMLKDI